jgi:hypothetical protein
MRMRFGPSLIGALLLMTSVAFTPLKAQRPDSEDEREFGPVVRAYLGYLRNEQEVVDDRVSRREISRAYYRRNSNRIRALREIAMRIARESHNDYLPELEAVTSDEFSTLFERPPGIQQLVIGKVFNNTFRFVGSVRQVDVFYVFARLDPYEQADSKEKNSATNGGNGGSSGSSSGGEPRTRPRRVRDP